MIRVTTTPEGVCFFVAAGMFAGGALVAMTLGDGARVGLNLALALGALAVAIMLSRSDRR